MSDAAAAAAATTTAATTFTLANQGLYSSNSYTIKPRASRATEYFTAPSAEQLFMTVIVMLSCVRRYRVGYAQQNASWAASCSVRLAPSGAHASAVAEKPGSGTCTMLAPPLDQVCTLDAPHTIARRGEPWVVLLLVVPHSSGDQLSARTAVTCSSTAASWAAGTSHTQTAWGMFSFTLASRVLSGLHASSDTPSFGLGLSVGGVTCVTSTGSADTM
jgi:hypothetical protein